MEKLIIIDEYFVDMGGHYYEYNKSVQEIFTENGGTAVIYANKKLDPRIQKELGAVPFFNGLSKNALNKIPVIGQLINRAIFWYSLYRKIKELYELEFAPDTVFFFTTVVWYNVLPVALAASGSKSKNVLLYRTSFTEHPGLPASLTKAGNWLYKYTFGKLKQNRNVVFCTDSDVIATECKQLFECNMGVLPIPHIKDDTKDITNTIVPVAPKEYVLYAPGAIRTEKGIRFIAEAFEYMAQIKHPILDKITLVTQYSETGDVNLNAEIKERLKKLPVKNIFLGNLSTDSYNDQLRTADIMLIPYSMAHGYRARTSGIMSETIAASKPFITTKDSWMSIQSEKYDTGLSVSYGSAEEFTEALVALTTNYEIYKEKAVNAKAGWLSYHSKQNFYKLLKGIINSKQVGGK